MPSSLHSLQASFDDAPAEYWWILIITMFATITSVIYNMSGRGNSSRKRRYSKKMFSCTSLRTKIIFPFQNHSSEQADLEAR